MRSINKETGCAGVIFMTLLQLIFAGVTTSDHVKERIEFFWLILTGTGSMPIAFLTMGKIWLSDYNEFLAGMLGLAMWVTFFSWFIHYFVTYGEPPTPHPPQP